MEGQNTITAQEAVLFHNVYAPAFVEKCAELGMTFDSPAALDEALETAALVQVALGRQSGGVVKQANLALKRSLGFDVAEAAMAEEGAIKQAAAAVSQHPDIRSALLASTLGR